jgi:hypothetical protein
LEGGQRATTDSRVTDNPFAGLFLYQPQTPVIASTKTRMIINEAVSHFLMPMSSLRI